MSRRETVDHEVVEVLRSDPQLLAIAGLLGSTLSRHRKRVRRLSAAGVGVGIAAALLVGSMFFSSSTSLTSNALAAVGDGPALHAVIAPANANQSGEFFNLSTGRSVERPLRIEMWFNKERGLKRTLTWLGDATLGDILETPSDAFSDQGPVYTCKWIAAHPREAAEIGVSCEFGGSPGSQIRQPAPTVDPALAGFVTNYSAALRSGNARWVGQEALPGGQKVHWLELSFKVRLTPTTERVVTERVAVDDETHKPTLVVSGDALTRQTKRYTVLEIETRPYRASDFARPHLRSFATAGRVTDSVRVSPQTAGTALGGDAVPLWLGKSFNNLALVDIELQQLRTRVSQGEPIEGAGLSLRYVNSSGSTELALSESSSCPFAYGWRCGAADPGPGFARATPFGLLVRTEGLYITIRGPGAPEESLDVARALTPMPASAR